MTLIRGRGLGLEIALAGRAIDEALDELDARLAERPGFYSGTSAVASCGEAAPTPAQLARLRAILEKSGVALKALAGTPEVGEVAGFAGIEYEAAAAPERELDRRRALRPRGDIRLSEAARSLVADFAGARTDIAERRRRGDSSVPRTEATAPQVQPVTEPTPAAALHVVSSPPETLYHAGTVRGGQALHHLGNIVVVGDVNPGAELLASGDVVVFGRLAGVAHAGAQGDASARVYALQLAATQLRIATFIAADEGELPRSGAPTRPDVAFVHDGRIVVVPFEQLTELGVSQT